MTEEDKLRKKVARLTEQVARLKERNAILTQKNKDLRSDMAEIKASKKRELSELEAKLKARKSNPYRSLMTNHPGILNELRALCQEWNIGTRNNANTSKAILSLITPDANGVVITDEGAIINYIKLLRRIGKIGYLKDRSLNEYYYPSDSIILFKHYVSIRKLLLARFAPKQLNKEDKRIKYHQATIKGVSIEGTNSAICTLEYVEQQKIGEPHPNDSIELSEFKGDDLIYERERRVKKKTGKVDLSSIPARQQYMYDRIIGEKEAL